MSRNVADARLFDHDPLTGITEYYHYDPETEGFTIETVQPVGDILEVNKYRFNNAPLRHGEWSHVASIPNVIMMELAKNGVITTAGQILDQPRFKRWLNDRDNRLFRTRPGIV